MTGNRSLHYHLCLEFFNVTEEAFLMRSVTPTLQQQSTDEDSRGFTCNDNPKAVHARLQRFRCLSQDDFRMKLESTLRVQTSTSQQTANNKFNEKLIKSIHIVPDHAQNLKFPHSQKNLSIAFSIIKETDLSKNINFLDNKKRKNTLQIFKSASNL